MWTLDAAGAAMDQGILQGRAAQTQILRDLKASRARAGWFNWNRTRRRASRLNARPADRFLPQLAEREQGIAEGAALRPGVLAAIALSQRIRASGRICVGCLTGDLDNADLAGQLLFRRSAPDEVGLRSLELVAPAWAGCWAGVNEAGVAAVVLEEFGGPGPRAALYAQDLLFRASELRAGLHHLETRSRYAGGSGSLLVADESGAAARVDLTRGRFEVSELSPDAVAEPARSQLRIDLRSRRLEFSGERAEL